MQKIKMETVCELVEKAIKSEIPIKVLEDFFKENPATFYTYTELLCAKIEKETTLLKFASLVFTKVGQIGITGEELK